MFGREVLCVRVRGFYNLESMHLTGVDKFFWLAGFLISAILLGVLLGRRRWRSFPFFTAYIAFQLCFSAGMYLIYRYGARSSYARFYWIGAAVDFLLQLCLLFEIARNVLRPTGTWVREARFFFWALSIGGLALGALLTSLAKPHEIAGLALWQYRGNLFTSLLTCELYLALLATSNFLGLVWRNHTMGLGLGLSSWALMAVAVNVSHLVGSYDYARTLDHLKVITYTFALLYWIYTFWTDEPSRRELPPGMKKYLLDVHQSVLYDQAVGISHKGLPR